MSWPGWSPLSFNVSVHTVDTKQIGFNNIGNCSQWVFTLQEFFST